MRRFLLFVVLLASCALYAQDFALGGVTAKELKESIHPADSSAPAAILYRKGKTYFELRGLTWTLVTEVESRIKIYKKSGYEYANEEIYYYTGSSVKDCGFSEAFTYNLENGSIVKTELNASDQYTDTINKYVLGKKIKMPNVKEGSVIEYKYKIAMPNFWNFSDWYFQDKVPVNYMQYEISIPTYFTFNSYLSGDVIKSLPMVVKRNYFSENRIVYTAKNMPALKDEAYINNIRNYMASVKHELSAVDYHAGEEVQKLSTTWTAVAKSIYEDEDFGKQLTQTSYFRRDVDALLLPGMTFRQKADAIFKHVQQRMNWNEYVGYYSRQGVKEAYKKKVGNVAEINLMLTAMLQYAGLKANPVLVSTRSHGVSLYPSHSAFNYVIASVKTEQGLLLLDATSKNTMPGILPVRALNWDGRMIMDYGQAIEVDLMPKVLSQKNTNVSAQLDGGGKITGKVRRQFFDYYAYAFRDDITGLDNEATIQKLEKEYNGLEVTEHAIVNKEVAEKPVVQEFTFTNSAVCDVIKDKLYFSPMLFFAVAENPFKQDQRLYPIDFKYPFKNKYMVTVGLPDGYVVESVPTSGSFVLPDGLGSFKYTIGVQDKQLQLTAIYEITEAIISEEYYTALKSFFTQMIEKQNEKIVLKKQ